MALFSKDVTLVGRSPIIVRVLVALLVPSAIVAWLLYSAASNEESVHARNLRWLAQMANQISDRVLNYDGIVRQAAHTGNRSYLAVEGLKHEDNPEVCAQWKELTTGYADGKQKLRFKRIEGGRSECAQYDVAKLVEHAIHAGLFTSVVLADRSGTVLYQSGLDSLRMTNVSFLFANTGEQSNSRGGSTSGAKPTPERDDAAKGKSDVKDGAPTSSMHITRQIGDARFSVFVQPILLPTGEGDDSFGRHWLLIGLIERHGHFESSPPRDVMLVLPLALLLGLLSWPLTKLWSMPASDPLMPRHVVQIVVCSLLGVLVFTLLGMSLYLRGFSSLRTDNQLRRLADGISTHFNQERELAIKQLTEIDKSKGPELEKDPLKAGIFNQLDARKIHTPFDYIDWITGQGKKEIRWTPKGTPAQPVDVKDRQYFRDLADGESPPFAMEQILSRTTGEISTAIAIPSDRRSSKTFVASILMTFASTTEPVLPRGFGFAIIDHDGTVLFHSDHTRILVEKFFDECKDSRELKAIVDRRGEAFLNVTYQAASQRIMVSPLCPPDVPLPWTLIVFRDLAPVWATRAQWLIDTIVLLIIYVMIAGLMTGATCLVFRRRSFTLPIWDLRWWANPGGRYPLTALAGLTLLLFTWFAMDQMNGNSLFYIAMSTAFAFIVIGASPIPGPSQNLPFWSKLSETSQQSLLRKAWYVWTAEFALAIAVMPCFLLGKLAFEYEIGLRIRDSQLTLWKQDRDKRSKLTREISRLPGIERCSDKRNQLLDALGLRGTSPLYFYGDTLGIVLLQPSPSKYSNNGHAASASEPDFLKLLLAASELPYEDRTMGFDMRKNELQPASGFWRWSVDRSSISLLNQDAPVVRSRLPKFTPLDPISFVRTGVGSEAGATSPRNLKTVAVGTGPSVLVIALAVAFAVWMVKLRSHLLIDDIDEPELQPVNLEIPEPEAQRLFILVRAGTDIAPLLNCWPPLQRINCASPDLGPEFQSKKLLLYHFEAHLADENSRLAKLDRLEAALSNESRPIVVISTIDVLPYLTTGGAGSTGKLATPAEIYRWRSVLSHFETRAFGVTSAGEQLDSAAIWNGCSNQEQRLLIQLCRYNLINPQSASVLRGLLRRRLIRRNAAMSFDTLHPRFSAFVSTQPLLEEPQEIKGQTGHKHLPTYALALILLGIILFVAEEEITIRLIGFLTTVAAGFDTVRKQLAGVAGKTSTRKA